MTLEEIAVKVASLEQRSMSCIRRIEKLELQTEAVQKLAMAIERIAMEQSNQTKAIERIEKDVGKLDSKVDTLEKKPAKRWDSVVEKIIMLLIAAVMTFLLAKIGL